MTPRYGMCGVSQRKVMKAKEILEGADVVGTLSLKYEITNKSNKPRICCSEDVAKYAELFYLDHNLLIDYNEYVVCLYTSNNGTIIGGCEINEGSGTQSIIDYRKIVAVALLCGATNVAMVHNHPMSSAFPSQPDRNSTSDLRKALQLFNIRLLDHVIIGGYDESGKHTYYSMNENGDL